MNGCTHCIRYYHEHFEGDTYDACARCGGKCEKFKISTLMPGEKEYMAEKLNLTVEALEENYLSRIDTPFGQVEVLKMKNNCNFLDGVYRCTAIPAKPVMCDTYPIVFYLTQRKVHFEIDRRDCPMVHWREYDRAVEVFATKGIQTMKEMKMPLSWWRVVALFDEFDVDYVAIEKKLATTAGYESFQLEKILGYACNGYEKKARRRGFILLTERIGMLKKRSLVQLERIAAGQPVKIAGLASAYARVIRRGCDESIAFLAEQKALPGMLSDADNSAYLNAVREGFRSLNLLEEASASFVRRLKRTRKYASGSVTGSRTRPSPIDNILDAFKVALRDDAPPMEFFELTGPDCREFWDSLVLLSGTFHPNEIDAPESYIHLMKGKRHAGGKIAERTMSGRQERFWSKWIMVCAKDARGRFMGAADGALIVAEGQSVFYFSHIAVDEKHRVNGIGSLLTAATLQAADNAIPSGWKALGIDGGKASGNGPRLNCELTEIEFPDLSFTGTSSIKRLPFHGRLERLAIWPFRYAQPDTDYTLPDFEEDKWNSVPMFLAYRSFPAGKGTVEQALAAADLMFDYFIVSMGHGAGWDKEYVQAGLQRDGMPRLLPFPHHRQEIANFIEKTGTLPVLLEKYYPGHRFTNDFLK